MRKYLFYLAAAVAAGAGAPASALGGWTAESALTALSDYRWRGASMTDERGALQAGFDVSHDSGFWAWVGGGNVAESYGGTELSLAAGFAGETGGFAWTFGAEHTAYPEHPEYDYYVTSAEIGRSHAAVTVSTGFEYAPAQANLDEDDRYVWAGAAVQATRSVRVRARAGKNWGAFASAAGAVDYEAGVTLSLAGLEFDVAHVGSDSADGGFVLGITARR